MRIKQFFGFIGVIWGLFGFSLLICSAVFRLSKRVFEVDFTSLTKLQIVFLIVFTIFMLISEGYKGFHKKLCPRFASRAKSLLDEPNIVSVIFAPLFCVGYICATRKRMISSYLLTVMIILFILIVSRIEQPWRGLLDVGVVSGLIFGLGSLYVKMIKVFFLGEERIDPEFSAQASR